MSKTTPVRWWRSDEERYLPRGAYKAPQPEPTRWDIEMIAGPPPAELQAALDYLDSLPPIGSALGLSADAWNAPEHVRPLDEIMAERRRLRGMVGE